MSAIYIAGPMSGLPEFNFSAFFKAERHLLEQGWTTVYNPAAKDAEEELDAEAYDTGDAVKAIAAGFDFRDAYLWDIDKVIKGDAVYMLRGWEKSPGARGEHAVAVAMQKHYPDYEIIYE